jgi:hypothetical protein
VADFGDKGEEGDNNTDLQLLSIDSCAICLAEYEHAERIKRSCNCNCKHVFHAECILDWLEQSKECPCCRADYIDSDIDIDVEQGEVRVVGPTVSRNMYMYNPDADTDTDTVAVVP